MGGNLAYQDEQREELIDGEIIMMPPASPGHNRLALKIAVLFENYLKGKKCVPFGNGTAVFLTDKDHFIPDGMVVCDQDKIKTNWVEGAPDLVWEILSPKTAKNDKWHKKNVYEACGVPEYWIVDPLRKSIEVYLLQSGRYVIDDLYTFYSAEELEYMTVDERADLVTEFKCHLYDDLIICLDGIFGDLF